MDMPALESDHPDLRHAGLQGAGRDPGHILPGAGRSGLCAASLLERSVCDNLRKRNLRLDRYHVQDDGDG